MKREINLSLGPRKDNTLAKRITLYSSIIFSIVVCITLGILSYRLFLSNQLSNLTGDEEVLQAQLNSIKEQRDKFVVVKERLGEAKRILGRRLNITGKFDNVEALIPSQASLETFNGTEEEVELRVESENLGSLSQLINEKIAELANDKKQGVQKIEMKSFLLNPITKKYTVVFSVTYK